MHHFRNCLPSLLREMQSTVNGGRSQEQTCWSFWQTPTRRIKDFSIPVASSTAMGTALMTSQFADCCYMSSEVSNQKEKELIYTFRTLEPHRLNVMSWHQLEIITKFTSYSAPCFDYICLIIEVHCSRGVHWDRNSTEVNKKVIWGIKHDGH